MIPTPILTVLSTFQKNGVQTLLMGGQACVFYGAAQVSKDVDLALLSDPANIERLLEAMRFEKARKSEPPHRQGEFVELAGCESGATKSFFFLIYVGALLI